MLGRFCGFFALLLPGPLPGWDEEFAICAASLAELYFGVLVARPNVVRAERLQRFGLIERSFDALAFNAVAGRHYSQMAAAAAALGRRPRSRTMDLVIAVMAAAHGARLYTRNAADLAALDQLVEIVALN